MRIGIAGMGGIALAHAAWLAGQGHEVLLWSPRGDGDASGKNSSSPMTVTSEGVVSLQAGVVRACAAAELADGARVLIVAVPADGHKFVMDALLPHLRDGQAVIVKRSMASLSSLYLFEAARALGRDVLVASFGTTVFTARRTEAARVRVMTRRKSLGVSALPRSGAEQSLRLCETLFGEGFQLQDNALHSVLANVNPIPHGPLALFNFTRIERAENWPQYHYLTPRIAGVIERLDGERIALGRAFGIELDDVAAHFARSFGTSAAGLSAIAAELHAKRGGPPGPTEVETRYLCEDMPFGLAFHAVLGAMAGVPVPATRAILDTASLVMQRDFAGLNDLVGPLCLADETVQGLLQRVGAPS